MNLPKFLLADNSNYPDDIFILHTDFPRFIINLKDDEVEFLDDLSTENEDDITNEMQQLIEKASAFYDEEMSKYD
ncbi:MAG: hypothetical protein HC798_02185 [Polaribacter sp.]|nr:hypothetical protein [Polaribacter sp.]